MSCCQGIVIDPDIINLVSNYDIIFFRMDKEGARTWEIIFFETSRSEKVVEEFLVSLQEPTQAKAASEIDLLEKHGPFLGMPHSKKLGGQLYELRIRSRQEIRIIYAFKSNKIYLLHAFKKQTQKTPQKELVIAQGRLDSLLTA